MTKIRIKHGDNEIEIEGTNEIVKRYIEKFYLRITQKKEDKTNIHPIKLQHDILKQSLKTTSQKPTPAEYYKLMGKTDGLSQVLIFGKYLDEFEGKTEFTPSELNKIANTAKISKPIHNQYFTNAVKQGLLRNQGKSRYSLTLSAEEILSAMKAK